MSVAERKPRRNTGSAERDALHQLVDELPGDEISVARLFLDYLKGGRSDPMLLAHATAPLDDETETEEERREVEAAWQEYVRGEARPWEEVRKELLAGE